VALQRCSNGHYYDPAKHTSGCPHCGIPGLDIGKTVPKRPPSEDVHTVPKEQHFAGEEPNLTQGIFKQKIGIDPPVGWLVCIDGPDRGMDYRIRSEINSIGRSEQMRICIAGDEGISRDNHAMLAYDPESNTYTIMPGTSRGIVYHNRSPVFGQTPLRPFDEIKLGATTLLFIPLCGDFEGRGFKWA
jgi:hypothetical protein